MDLEPDPESSQDYPGDSTDAGSVGGKGMLSAGQVNAELTCMYLTFRVRTVELFHISNSF